MKKWYKKLHWQIIIGLILGLIWGLFSSVAGLNDFTSEYIRPFGDIFVTLLKLIAIPLVLASLVVGISNLNDMSKLSRMGGKTIGIYMITTTLAIVIGLTIVNVIQPGKTLPIETRMSLMESYTEDVGNRGEAAQEVLDRGNLQFIVDIVPENFFQAA
ncbi:MAG: cation:dicarboxylase symporter family transporter, partial [Balneolaceae bacterium]|nr:cation:dicarboxylase symporter family transporter [Balneolaceae bacterium]